MIYKNYDIPDEQIDFYVDKLECSIVEACDAYLCDHGKIINQEQEELHKQNQGKTASFVGAAAGSQPNRGKKSPNLDKKAIIQQLFKAISMISDDACIKNDEKYIDFQYNDAFYTINLVKHRQNK